MEAGAVGARLASSVVVPLVKRLFRQDGPGAGLVERPVRIASLVSFRGEKRSLGERDVRKVAGELVERAVCDAPPRERPVPESEEAAITDAVARTLTVLGEIDMEDVRAVRLGHREFARLLRGRDTSAARDLSADGEVLYASLVDAACLHILHFFTQRSTFVARSLVEQSRQLEAVIERLDRVMERVPSLAAEDGRFERRYADFIDRKHGTLTIYGLDLQHSREWPLDTAYLSLEAVDERQREKEMAGALTGSGGSLRASQPAERALAGHERVLLRGVAGSGKTTLVQWLAITAARQDPVGGMTHLLGRVPLVLPLRTLTRGGNELPHSPDRFLHATACPLAGAQPDGWADRVLSAGRGLLLIDGMDEVPEDERERARRWLRDLLDAFPGNLWLVTSRPTAVREGWLGSDDFAELSLAPMGSDEVAAFIDRWHQAARAEPALAKSLREAVRGKQDLGRLATNPLMCGLICALHRERRGFLPRGRKALYDAALSMLLERRDRERDMHHRPGELELDEDSQVELLRKLAYWLIRNGRAEMEREDGVELLGRALPSMPHVAAQGTAEEVFGYLLLRSGLLREPAPGTVDFVHRTFQDYLGAQEAVEERDFALLSNHAHLDQWEDVLRMSVAHARPDERARLLRELVRRGDGEGEHRTRLHLLAMACLEHATKLDPAVRAEVEQRAAALIPPRSVDEARALADIGPVVLELLPAPESLENDEAVSVAETAGLIGGDAALRSLLAFRELGKLHVLHRLGSHWDKFDTETYADEIISYVIQRDDAIVTVRSDAELRALHRLGGAGTVALRGDFGEQQILDHLDPDRLVDLKLRGNANIDDLGFLLAFHRLGRLDLHDCPHVGDLSPLTALPLTHLWLWELPRLRHLNGVHALEKLSLLVAGGGVSWGDGLSALPPTAPLSTLRVPPDTGDLRGIEAWPGLEWVSLPELDRRLRPADWRALAGLPRLSELGVEANQLAEVPLDAPLIPHLTSLNILGYVDPHQLSHLHRTFPALENVYLSGSTEVDLAPLAALPALQRVHVAGSRRVRNAEELPGHVELSRFPRARDE